MSTEPTAVPPITPAAVPPPVIGEATVTTIRLDLDNTNGDDNPDLAHAADTEEVPVLTDLERIEVKLDRILARMDHIEELAMQIKDIAQPTIEAIANHPMARMFGIKP